MADETGLKLTSGDREVLIQKVAVQLDYPNLYMGGPSENSKRKAERVVQMLFTDGYVK